MNNIAIVGVEGSGKTVLMAAMGDKYKSPDANGVFLKPVNRETFAYCEKLMGQMQDGKWPIATGKAITENLRWTLTKKIADGDDDKIAELSFLDFGGEIYRLAFGGGVHEEPDEDTKNAIAQLRSHVEEAEVLIVLVNLSDIINGKRNEERTIEMNWLSQAILSFAYDEANKSSVALVFTQADSYAETIADCGGLRGVLTRYMPTVDTSYGKRLALFSVAAVNKTIPAPDGSGFSIPAPDFFSEGLGILVKWISDSAVSIKDAPKDEASKSGKIRGLFYWARRLFLCGLIVSSCMLGWAFGWEAIYREYFYFFSEVEECRMHAWETLNAVNEKDFEKFNRLVEMPRYIEKWTGVDKTTCAQGFAKRNGKFWDVCKGMRTWSYHSHYCYPERRKIKSCFECSLYGEMTSVFSFSGLSSGKSSYSDNDLLIALCVRKHGHQDKTVWLAFNKEERSK